MHIFFYIRGKADAVERWKHAMLNQYFKWERKQIIKDNDGKEQELPIINLVQGNLRECYQGMYEYVFPREALPEVLAMTKTLAPNNEKPFGFFALRKLYGLRSIKKSEFEAAKKIPTDTLLVDRWRGIPSVEVAGVNWTIIGIKEDKYEKITFYKDTPQEITYIQEWL